MSGGDYERWVVGLRTWRDNPATDLSALPPLDSASFTPATYARLLAHLQQALQAMTDAWSRRLQTAIDRAGSDSHELGRALVQLRAELARRIQLARHPGWPSEIATELERGAANDIRDLQAQLERLVRSAPTARGGSDRDTVEAQLRVLRENSFTAILDPGFDLDRLFRVVGADSSEDSMNPSPVVEGSPSSPDPAPARTPRRVIPNF